MSWLTDNPWTLATVCALAAALLTLVALRGATSRVWLAALAMWLLVPVPFLLDAIVVTDEETVRDFLHQLVNAAEQGDTKAIIASLSSSYHDGSRDRAAMEDLIRRQWAGRGAAGISLAGLELQRTGHGIDARFVAHVRDNGPHRSAYPIRLGVSFVQEDGWRIGSVRRYDLIEAMREIPWNQGL